MGRWMILGLALAGCSFDRGGGAGDGADGGSPPRTDAGPGADADPDQPDASGECVASALDFTPREWVEVADASLDLTDDFTVAAWIAPRAIDGEHHIASRHDHGASEGWVLMIKDRAPEMRVYFADDQGPPSDCACTTDQELAEDRWTHVAGSFAAGTAYLFVDGVLLEICDCDQLCSGCETAAVAPYGGPLAIGIESSSLDRFAYDGFIDDVTLLGAAQNANFDPATAARCSPDTLLGFPFDAPVEQELASDCGAAPTGRLGSTAGPDANDPTAVEVVCPDPG